MEIKDQKHKNLVSSDIEGVPEVLYHELQFISDNNTFNNSGAIAKVHRVLHRKVISLNNDNLMFERIMIVKKPKDHLFEEELFTNEINILHKLSHPNIINFFGKTKIVMINHQTVCSLYCPLIEVMDFDLIDYSSKIGLRSGSPFRNYKFTLKIVLKIARAIQYLHQQNPPIIHCDIKPENTLIKETADGDPIVKICDFGAAVELNSRNIKQKFISTPAYSPPEAVKDKYYTPHESFDIYSLGCVLYMLMLLKTPWSSFSKQQVVEKLKAGESLSIITEPNNSKRDILFGDYPQQIIDLCNQCILADPKKRPKINDIIATLSEYV